MDRKVALEFDNDFAGDIRSQRSSLRDVVSRPIDASLFFAVSLLTLAPYALGGRTACGQLAILFLLLAWAAAWSAKFIRSQQPRLEWSWSYALWIAGAMLAVIQIVPLNTATIDFLSPRIREILPLWGDASGDDKTAGFGSWQYLSLTPGRTIDALVLFGLLAAVWFLAVQQFRSVEQIRTLMMVLFVGAVLLAIFGLIQWMFWDGRFFWTFSVPGVPTERYLHGPFTNRNHFAGFLALSVGPACYWIAEMARGRRDGETPRRMKVREIFSRVPREIRLFGSVAGLATIVATILLSLSRGGAIAALVALPIAGVGLAIALPGASRSLLVCGAVGVSIVGGLSLVGLPAVSQRLGTLLSDQPGATVPLPGRFELWTALVGAMSEFPIFGTGFGSHRYVYPLHMRSPKGTVFTHAENCYLQLWVEGGLIAASLLALALLFIGYWAVRAIQFGSQPNRCIAIAIVASILASAIHACVDFVWYVPAYAIAVLVLVAALLRLSVLSEPISRGPKPSRTSMARSAIVRLAPALVAVVGFLAIRYFVNKVTAELAWFQYLRQLAAAEHPSESASPSEQAKRIYLLQRCLAARPNDVEAHLKLAEVCTARAATANDDEHARYREQARHHFRAALAQCPLIGEAYLGLANLAASRRGDAGIAAALAAQAIRVRPHQPEVTFAAGYELFRQGRPAAALGAWKLAARAGSEWEQRVIELVAPHADPSTIVRYLDPSPLGIVWAADHCGSTDQSDKRRELLKLARSRLEGTSASQDVAPNLLLLHQVCDRLSDTQAADRAMERFVRASGRDFESLLIQADWYRRTGRPEQSLRLLERCRAERPEDARVASLVKELTELIARGRASG